MNAERVQRTSRLSAFLTRVGGAWTYGRWLVMAFVASLVFLFPNVGSDGVGYYAYVRSLLIDGDLQFENEMVAGGLMQPGDPDRYSPTGHVSNEWAVGTSILWSPLIVVAHVAVLALNAAGMRLSPDGYSWLTW